MREGAFGYLNSGLVPCVPCCLSGSHLRGQRRGHCSILSKLSFHSPRRARTLVSLSLTGNQTQFQALQGSTLPPAPLLSQGRVKTTIPRPGSVGESFPFSSQLRGTAESLMCARQPRLLGASPVRTSITQASVYLPPATQ